MRLKNEIIQLMFRTFTERVIKLYHARKGDQIYCEILKFKNRRKISIYFYQMYNGNQCNVLKYTYELYQQELDEIPNFDETYITTCKGGLNYETYQQITK